MTNNVIIDLETIDTVYGGGILSLGIIVFDFDEIRTFDELIAQGREFKLDIRDQLENGYTTSQSTMEWWAKQGVEAQRVLAPSADDIKVADLPALIDDTIMTLVDKETCWYARGHMDINMLSAIYDRNGRRDDYSWSYWMPRDVRTAVQWSVGARRGYIDLPEGSTDGMIAHNALHDCARDVLIMQRALHIATGKVII